MELAALAQADGGFDPGALEVDVEGNQGEALLIDGDAQFVDLFAVGQQPAGPEGLVVEVGAGVGVGGDVDVVQLQLSLADQAEAIPQVDLPSSDGLDLGAHQLDPAFEGFEDFVLVPRKAVVRQQFVGGVPKGLGVLFAPALSHGAAISIQ